MYKPKQTIVMNKLECGDFMCVCLCVPNEIKNNFKFTPKIHTQNMRQWEWNCFFAEKNSQLKNAQMDKCHWLFNHHGVLNEKNAWQSKRKSAIKHTMFIEKCQKYEKIEW